MKALLCTLGLLLAAIKPADPIKIGMKEVLASVNQDEQWRLSLQTADWLGKQNYQSPLLQKLELRLGSNDLSLSRQQYGIRLSPNAFGQSKYQQKQQNAQMGLLQAETEIYWNQALLQRYKAIAEYYYANQLLTTARGLDSLLQDQTRGLRAMVRQGLGIKIKDLVENEQDQQAIQLDLSQYQGDQQQARERIRQFLASSAEVELDLQNFISIARIVQIVTDMSKIQTSPLFAETKVRQAQAGLVQSEIDLLKKRNEQYLSFFQFGYERAPKTPTLDDDLFIRLGLNIPLGSNNRLKNNELALELYEAKAKSTISTARHTQELALQQLKTSQLLQAYQLRETQEEKNLAVSILSDPELRAQISPLELLELKLLRQKKQFDRLKLAHQLTQEYLNLLYLNGNLVQKPLLNYLSTGLEPW